MRFKLFPADVFGTLMLTRLRAVLPKGTLVLPVGGVDAETIPVWRDAGAGRLRSGIGFV